MYSDKLAKRSQEFNLKKICVRVKQSKEKLYVLTDRIWDSGTDDLITKSIYCSQCNILLN